MKFCGECGARLKSECAACGAANPPGNKFCGQCGGSLAQSGAASKFTSPSTYTPKHLAEKILTSKSALEGERKQVTVLFADMKGSMELLADRDPEEARKLLDPVIEHMMEAVHRYEGTVSNLMGDGIMALFGAPLAHEDHAVPLPEDHARACYAALRMQESVNRYAEEVRRTEGVPIQIRVGSNSGEVVVGSIGNDLKMDYTAVGQTVHLASRVEQIANPGAIVITRDTLALAEGYVEVKSLGPVPVKGLADPVEVYEVTGAGPARTRLQAGAQRGLTRFVGRDAELEQLRRAQQLASNGHGQVAAIIGEAGVGKSRLIHECTHSLRQQGWLVLGSASVPYGKAISYLPVIDLLKDYFKIRGRLELREIRETVIGKLLALDRSLEPTLPALLALLDLPVEDAAWEMIDPEQRRQRTIDAVKRLLLRESQVQPLLLVFEDLHWIDSETQAVADSLVESLPTARMLLLVNHRPEYQHGWGSKTYYSQIRIDPLPPESAMEVLGALLGDDHALLPLKDVLIARTEGTPFFLEESVRTMVEMNVLAGERGNYRLVKPIESIQVPASVQAMLAARIDRLTLDAKQLLQCASVIGKDFPYALLPGVAELTEENLKRELGHLQAAEFIYETRLFPDLEYTFKHALTHEVAYGSLLQDRRRELHARIAGAIETLHHDRLVEHIERLAHHALRGELREKAVDYLRQAGLKGAARSALADARGWFEQALDVLGALPESRSNLEQGYEIRLDLRPVLLQLSEGRRALERLREAQALAERLTDDGRQGHVYAFMTVFHSLLGELDEALTTGTRALEIAGRLGDLRLRILATSFLAQTHYYRGEYERVVELATDNLAALPADWIYERLGSVAPVSVLDRVWLIVSLAQLGRFAEAAPHEAEVIRLAEPTNHPFSVSLAYFAAGMLHLLAGDWAKAHSLVEHWIAAARAGNVAVQLPWAVACSAWILAQLGDANEAQSRLGEGEQLLERQATRGIVGHLGWAYHLLGRTCLLLGRFDEARRLGDLAVKSSPHQPGFAPHILHLLGDIATHPDRFDAERGEAHYRRALALAEPRGMRPVVAHCHLGLGKLCRRTGEQEQAREHLATAATMYRDMAMRFWLDQVEAETRASAPC